MHKAGMGLGEDLVRVERLPVHDRVWRQAEIERANTLLARVVPQAAVGFKAIIASRATSHDLAIARVVKAELPLAACAWDFKASNLVYTVDRGPVLVDPDHGACIPRLYDLACCALLFHCDCATAPGQLFSESQWTGFLAGYNTSVTFSMVEHRHWFDVLTAAWMDQALWLLANWPEGWENSRDRDFLTDLASNSLATFGASVGRK